MPFKVNPFLHEMQQPTTQIVLGHETSMKSDDRPRVLFYCDFCGIDVEKMFALRLQ